MILIIGFVAGCQQTSAEVSTPSVNTSSPVSSVVPTQGDVNMTPSSTTPSDPQLQSLVEKTKDDLADRLGISPTEISLVEITEVEWSDSSLDCPQPGMEYLQVITPGYRIVLGAGGQSHEYHTNKTAYFVYCENTSPPEMPNP